MSHRDQPRRQPAADPPAPSTSARTERVADSSRLVGGRDPQVLRHPLRPLADDLDRRPGRSSRPCSAALAFPEDVAGLRRLPRPRGGVLGYFLPILVILLVTSEWSQRTGLATFSLEPRRRGWWRPSCWPASASPSPRSAIARRHRRRRHVASARSTAARRSGTSSCGQVRASCSPTCIGVLVGFALATLLRNTPAAIVVLFVYTFVAADRASASSPRSSTASSRSRRGSSSTPPRCRSSPATTGPPARSGPSSRSPARSGSVVPLALGIWRILRAEVKWRTGDLDTSSLALAGLDHRSGGRAGRAPARPCRDPQAPGPGYPAWRWSGSRSLTWATAWRNTGNQRPESANSEV